MPGVISADWWVAITAIAVFSLMSVVLAIASRGFLEGDACSHYLAARAAFAEPVYLVNVWCRPICTGVYTLPAHFAGRLGVRLTSLCMAIAIALLTRSIAKRQGWRWPTLALIFLLAQPLVFLHSFSEMTELPFALLMAIGFWAYQRRQFLLFALAIGLTPLSRPEGFGFIALAAFALIVHRRWWWTIVLLTPLFAWDYAGWRLNGSQGPWWNWLHSSWPWGQESLYERGPLLHFVMLLPVIVSPFLLPAMVIGMWLCLTGNRRRVTLPGLLNDFTGKKWLKNPDAPDAPDAGSEGLRRAGLNDATSGSSESLRTGVPTVSNREANHLRRCELLIVGLPLIILIGHSLLYWLGKMASNGEIRYMMVVAPLWALLSARGWSWAFINMDWRRPLLWGCFAAMLPILVNRAWTVLPMDNSIDWTEAEQIARWYKTGMLNGRPIEKQFPFLEISHVGLTYALDIDPRTGRLRNWTKTEIDARPRGTILIWDRIGALFNSDASRKVPLDEIRRAGWKQIKTPWTDGAGEWQFFVSEPLEISEKKNVR